MIDDCSMQTLDMEENDGHNSSGSGDNTTNAPLTITLAATPAAAAAAAASSSAPVAETTTNSLNDFADDEDENNDSSAHPLLSSIKKKVKMGSFSIRYNPHQKQHSGHHRATTSQESQFHDFIPNASNNDQSTNTDNDEDDLISTLQYNRTHTTLLSRLLYRLTHHHQSTTTICCFFLPLRILLLALYLAFTLSSFWILDSIKEPTLAILVHGDLGRHQPRAKMVSFVVVIVLALGMEWLDRWRRCSVAQMKRRRKRREDSNGVDRMNEELERSWEERNLPLSMRESMGTNESSSSSSDGSYNMKTKWRSMKVRSGQFWNHHFASWTDDTSTRQPLDDDDDGEEQSSSSKITTIAFYIVGSFYIHGFIAVALALKTHPSFSSKAIFHDDDANLVAELESGGIDVYPSSEEFNTPLDERGGGGEKNGGDDWYYPALGYVLFALVESFGSVSITIFWAFANSHLSLETAERHYGSIVALAQMGAIAGSTFSALSGRRKQQHHHQQQQYEQQQQQQQQHFILDEEGRVDVDRSVDTIMTEDDDDARVTPMLLFAACGCIGVGMVIMATYAQLFSKPMQDNTIRSSLNADRGDDTTRQKITVVGKEEEEDQYILTRSEESKTQQVGQSSDDDGGGVTSDDLLGGLRMIFRYEYLKLVLAASVLYEIALTCMHYELNLIGLDRFGVGISIVDESEHSTTTTTSTTTKSDSKEEEGITYIQFMGWYGQTVNILSLFLSFYAFPRLIKNYGLSTTIRIFPTVLLLVTIFAFVMFPRNLYFLFISLSICKALTYSVHDPSEEVLYMPTSDAVKFKAKFWIDVVGQRIAKAIGSVINNYAGSVDGILKYGSLPSIVTALILWLACYQVGMQFDGLIQSGNVVGDEDEAASECIELEMSEQIIGCDSDDDDSDLFRDPEEDVVLTKFGKANRSQSGSEHVLL